MTRQINLYDARFLKKRDWLAAQSVLLIAGLSVVGVGVGAGVARWLLVERESEAKAVNEKVLAARAAFAELTKTLATRKPDAALIAEIETVQQETDSARQSLSVLQGMASGVSTRLAVADMMRAFARTTGDGMWLTGLAVSEGGTQLEIRGRMLDQALLPAYLRRLEAEPVFQGRRFAALDLKGGEWKPLATSSTVDAGNGQKSAELQRERWYVEFVLRSTHAPQREGGDDGRAATPGAGPVAPANMMNTLPLPKGVVDAARKGLGS